ncbi:predicted protein [Histoplasma mississippiense (nom. inval.)]|uniref:predicted protein n=1 Tax=Ajellomyces capsulatus (strain NAm1 / WU24) TaxID=2059318 RepID=UPI000157BCBD|nr:predicted protein [Histoplasma mississippiense (nom. inval.)]EDN06240.1 predicted protein [Histoplasma mississippiense (nom. inval.)]
MYATNHSRVIQTSSPPPYTVINCHHSTRTNHGFFFSSETLTVCERIWTANRGLVTQIGPKAWASYTDQVTMTSVDEIAEDKGETKWIAWKERVLDSMDEIATFVAHRRQGGDPERIVHYYRGSFNICIHIKFKDTCPDAAIRFTKAGVTAFRDEKADFMLQLYNLDFTHIRAISEVVEGANTWAVTGRPLTYNKNELATSTGYPIIRFPTECFSSANECFKSLADQHLIHLHTQHNLTTDPKDARRCETLQITAVLDLEFTNTMLAQFAYDLPWWLLLVGPDMWLKRGYTMADFVAQYTPRLKQSLYALEQIEAEKCRKKSNVQRISKLMRNSWTSGELWFNFTDRKSLDVDAIFYHQLDMIYLGVNLMSTCLTTR